MKNGQVQTVVMVLFLGATSLVSSGCGVYMAFTHPRFVDTAALEAGVGWSREAVIEKLGAPRSSVRNADGTRVELYEFYEESETGSNVGRGIGHLAMDIFTFGVWEIRATRTEYAIRGDKLTGQATFDKDDRLASFRVLGVEFTEPEPMYTWQPTYGGY
ncbi:MAG: hypothetical protein HP493_14455 [Nitrospira sp.]|nr:hypothetical protein [Nitrospira sp.]